jgi:DNA-directed RNA polymerase alpha subunit
MYHKLTEYRGLEEIQETTLEIKENLSKLKLKTPAKTLQDNENIEVGIAMIKNRGKVLAKDLKLPQKMLLINPEQPICTILSPEIKLRIIIKIELRAL